MAKVKHRTDRREDDFYETMPAVDPIRSNGARRVVTDEYDRLSTEDVVVSAITYVTSIIEILLFTRLILRLFGSISTNAIVSFIYAVTRPLIAPFANMFGITTIDYSIGTIEIVTIVAMIAYVLIAWALIGLVRLFRDARAT